MSTTNLALPADTPIAIKVTLGDGDCRRIKLALRDLGPTTLPEKLRQLLIIPPTQDIVLERFSDSAGAYIILDSNNPSIYKQLYRAAKAKLKLRIKVSIVDSSAPKPHTIDPEFLCTDRLSSNCYVPPTTPILAKTEFDGPLSAPANLGAPVGSAEVPALSSRLAQAQAQAEHSGRLFASRYRQELPPTTHLSSAACCMNPAAMSVKLASMGSAKDAPVATGAEDESSSPRVFSPRDHFYAELGNMSRDCPSSFLRTADQVISMPGSSFTICCNHCDVAIPNVHWHCGRCDNGDFDLCTDCVNKGILCDSTDHWLIKRFVQNGKVTNSTTERIEPKKAPAVETVVAKEAPAAQATVCESEILHEAHEESRTCNSCISVFPEENFFTCTVCDNYDLCTVCLIGKKHGHHPNHTLAPVSKFTFTGSVTSDLCKPGRNVRHRATCDGCDKEICGVRHKCLDCPDWDYCSHCIKDARKSHPGHRFAPLWDPIPWVPQRPQCHYGIQCDGPLCTEKSAHAYIMGDRYKCAVCHDTDFCANCEAFPMQRHNRTHPLIKIKTPIKHVSVTTLGEKDNGEQMVTMGDQPPQTSSKSTETTPATTLANAATQVQGISMPKPSEPIKDEPKVQFKGPTTGPLQSKMQAYCMGVTVANGTILAPSATFTQVWTLRNSGPVKWFAGSSVRFVGGDIMYNVDLKHPSSTCFLEKAARSNIIGHVVEVGEQAEFSVIMKAPEYEGPAISYWRLMDHLGIPFGPKFECNIEVRSPPQPVVEREVETEDVAEPAEEDGEGQDDEEKLGSQMIFPKLEKESPVASTHEAESEAVTSTSDAKLIDDLEDLELDSEDESDGFLTDEEYDLLDMSDAETCVTPHGGN